MKVLIVSSRFPWPSYTGDRIRASIWLDALRSKAAVTLVAPAGDFPEAWQPTTYDPQPPTHVLARRAVLPFLRAAAASVLRGLPFHALITAGFDWKRALAHAEKEHGPFDCAVVLLSRLDPWVRPHLRAPRLFLDAIDSLALSTDQRAHAAEGLARLFWSMEARRTRKLEMDIAPRYERVLVVSEAEAPMFGSNAAVIPNGVTVDRTPGGERLWDCAFWGRLGYFANHDAAMTLLRDIWPRVRAARPGATLLIAGADAATAVLRFHGRDGVEVHSPVADLRSLIRRVRVAVFPVRFGTGQATKVLEAAEAACALVATPQAMRGLASLAGYSAVHSTPAELGDATVRLLSDSSAAEAMGARLRDAVRRDFAREATLQRLAALILQP